MRTAQIGVCTLNTGGRIPPASAFPFKNRKNDYMALVIIVVDQKDLPTSNKRKTCQEKRMPVWSPEV